MNGKIQIPYEKGEKFHTPKMLSSVIEGSISKWDGKRNISPFMEDLHNKVIIETLIIIFIIFVIIVVIAGMIYYILIIIIVIIIFIILII